MKLKFKTVSIYSSLDNKKVHSIISQVDEVLSNLNIRVLMSKSIYNNEYKKKKFYSDNQDQNKEISEDNPSTDAKTNDNDQK